MHEIDFLPVGDGARSGDAIALRYGNLKGTRAEQTVIVIDGGFNDDGEALVELIKTHYDTGRVNVVLGTHLEQDHIGGLAVVLRKLEVGQLWMHQPWVHSSALAESRSARFSNLHLSERLQESMRNASDLEDIAGDLEIPIVEPFTGLATPDGCFYVIGPDRAYYEELLGLLPQQETTAAAVLRKLAEAVQKLVPESLSIETLTDAGKTTAQNNSSVISVLKVERMHQHLHRRCWNAGARQGSRRARGWRLQQRRLQFDPGSPSREQAERGTNYLGSVPRQQGYERATWYCVCLGSQGGSAKAPRKESH